jgi:4-oxalocrotonate tautomerase
MPILTVKLAAQRSPELTREVAGLLLDLTARTLRKDRNVTAIAIDYVDPEDWFVGGAPLAQQGRRSFFVDVRITDETNTKDEKARYVAEAFAGLQRILGDVHEESYVHVHDVRAAAYGYGGRTQEYRYQAAAR